MKAIRYIIKDNDYKCGFLSALDEYFDTDTIFNLSWIFEDKLKCPVIDMNNTISYFTVRGNRAFHKAIKKCELAYKNIGIEFIRDEKDILDEDILYQDEYQIICKY